MPFNSEFSIKLYEWHSHVERDLPWKASSDPYKIWLSEIILQQTRVAQGRPYYLKFVESFPTVFDLANAELDEVLLLWQGLGYYSRARNMHQTARIVADQYKGKFPDTYAEISALKGIGDYTASAILSFAFNKPYPVLDGNVKRVISRYFNITEPIDINSTLKTLKSLLSEVFDDNHPAEFNQAIIDFGATQCVPKNPDCNRCPLRESCLSFATGTVHIIPTKRKKIKKKDRFFHYLFIGLDSIIIKQRASGDIWEGLHDFPLIEDENDQILNKKNIGAFLEETFSTPLNIDNSLDVVLDKKHVLTHQNLFIKVYRVNLAIPDFNLSPPFMSVPIQKLSQFAFPVVLQDFIKEN